MEIETVPALSEFAKTVGKAGLGYLKFIAEGNGRRPQPVYLGAGVGQSERKRAS